MASHAHSSKTNTRSEHAVRPPPGAEVTEAPPEHFDAEAAARHGHHFGDIRATAPARGASVGGQPLPASLHQEMRRSLGTDFSDVRLHVDSRPALHRKHALTQGNHIHVSPEAYRPHEPAGRGLLAHELTHVVQQRNGRVAQPSEGGPLNSDSGLEREADAVGMKVAEGGTAPLVGSRPSPAAGMASGPAAAAPIQGGGDFFKNLLNKFTSKKNSLKRKHVDALTKFEDLPDDKKGLLEDQNQHDQRRKYKLDKAKRKGSNLLLSGATKASEVSGLGSAVSGIKAIRNVRNDKKTLDDLELDKKFAQGDYDDEMPLTHPLAQEEPSPQAAQLIEDAQTVTKGKMAAHATSALIPSLLVNPLRKKLQKGQIEKTASQLEEFTKSNDPYGNTVLSHLAKGKEQKKDYADKNAKRIANIL